MMTTNRAIGAFRAPVVAALGALVLGSCGSGLTGPRQVAQRQLNEARTRWEALGHSNYDYDYALSCFCGPQITGPVRVQVRAGVVAAVVDRESGEPRSPLSSWYTIPGLFDRIQEWIDLPANTLDARYDPVTGLPTSVSVDPIRNAVDDEVAFTAGGLEPIGP